MAIKGYVFLCIFLASSLLVTLDALPATHNLYHRLQKRSGLRLCGRMLVEALAAICHSEYYAPGHIKRNYAYNSGSYPSYDRTYTDGVWSPDSSMDFFNINQLSRRGIADECCTKSCSIVQLLSYCGPNPGK